MDIAELALRVESRDVLTADKRVDQLNRTASRSPQVMRAFAGAVAGIGFTALAKSALDTYAAFETMNASLKTVTGSAEAASIAMSQIESFAATTPFSLEKATSAFIKLKSLGLDPSREALTSYGNTAAAMGKDLNQMIEAVADATTGEFERLKEFGIKAKSEGDKVSFTFQGITKTVGKNAQEIEGYLRDIGDVNFAGAMADQMDTLKGVTSNLSDNFEKLQRDFVESTGFGEVYKDMLKGLSEIIGSIDFDVISAQLSTWNQFGDDIGGVIDRIREFDGEFGTVSDTFGQISDGFKDLPVLIRSTIEIITYHHAYLHDYIIQTFNRIKTHISGAFLSIGQSGAQAFHSINIAIAETQQSVRTMLANLLRQMETVFQFMPNMQGAIIGIKAAAAQLESGTDGIARAQNAAAASSKEWDAAINQNKSSLDSYNVALAASKQVRDEMISESLNAVTLAKQERENLVAQTKELKAHEKITNELLALESDVNRAKTQNTAATAANSEAVKKLTGSKKKETEARDKNVISLEKEREKRMKIVQELIENNKAQQEIIEKGLDITVDQLKTLKKLDKTTARLYKTEIKRAQQLKKQSQQTKAYETDLESLNHDLEYNRIYLEQGAEAANTWTDAIKYGSVQSAENIKKLREMRTAQEQQINVTYGLADALRGLAEGGDLKDFGQAIIAAFDNGNLDRAFEKFSKNVQGLFQDNFNFSNIGATINSGVEAMYGGPSDNAFVNAYAGYMSGSQAAGLFGGGDNANKGGQIGRGFGSLFGPWGGLIGDVIGSWAGSKYDKVYATFGSGDHASEILQQQQERIEKYEQEMEQYLADGLGENRPTPVVNTSSTGFYNNRYAEGAPFFFDSEFGRAGLLHGNGVTQRLNAEQTAHVQATLDRMEAIDGAVASFLPKSDINRIKASLSEYRANAMDMEEVAYERLKIMANGFSGVLAGVADPSKYDSFNKLAARMLEISQAAIVSAPALKNLGLNIGFGEKATATALSLTELSGGLDKFLSLQQNYVSKMFSSDEQLLIKQGQSAQAIQKVADQLGISADKLDTAKELRAEIERINKSGELIAGGLQTITTAGEKAATDLVATNKMVEKGFNKVLHKDNSEQAQKNLLALLGIVDQVALLDEQRVSASAALAGVPEHLRDIVGGVQELITPYEKIKKQTEEVTSSFTQTSSSFNNFANTALERVQELEYSVNKIVPINVYNRNEQQEQLRKVNEKLAQQEKTNQNTLRALEAIAASNNDSRTALRLIVAQNSKEKAA